MQIDVEYVNEVTSTNDILLKQQPKEDKALVAFAQTKGKGRRGRQFFSPKDTGIYMSILLHPSVRIEELTGITTMMAVAASNALEKYIDESIDIKWVNDLYLHGRKIAGILTECSPFIEDGVPSYAVVGIGINIYDPEEGFPSDIENRAGSLLGKKAADKDLRRQIAESILCSFDEMYREFPEKSCIVQYRKRCFLIGHRVVILGGDEVLVNGIDDNFGLEIIHDDGSTEILRAGEVSLVI